MKIPWIICLFLFFRHGVVLGFSCDIQVNIFSESNVRYAEISYYIPTDDLIKLYHADSSYNHRIFLTLVLKSQNKIIRADKVQLQGAPGKDCKPMLYLVRWELRPGQYELETILNETGQEDQSFSIVKNFEVTAPSGNAEISDIQLLSTVKPSLDSSSPMVKRGFYFEPIAFGIATPGMNLLHIYLETYHTTRIGEKHYFLEYEIHLLDSNGRTVPVESWIKRREIKETDYVIYNKDISNLPSGKYRMQVSLKNRAQESLHSRQIEFYRYNPFWDRLYQLKYETEQDAQYFNTLSDDSIHIAIKALYPLISTPTQGIVDELINNKRLLAKRMFVYRYWHDNHGAKAVEEFSKYMNLVNMANRMFYSGFGYGFESDRGRIFLKYGQPIEIFREDIDSGAYPYEIWKYDKIYKTGQNNVKFLFYNPDLGGHNYRLLHSTAYGEVSNPKWELELYRKVSDEFEGENPIDAKGVKQAFSRRAREYFNE